jgi:hypothetical protein
MTVEHIREWLDEIRAKAKEGDHEATHGREDSMYQELVWSIAKGKCDDPAACCKEALKSKRIKFRRDCA